MGQPDIT
jgi:hypothetical protein